MSPTDPVGSLRYGQIVQATVPDGHGNTKARPVVIVTPTRDMTHTAPILAVCISTQVEYPIPPDHVALPWSNPRHPRTGLNKPNVAKCNWIVSVPPQDVVEVGGFVPARQMAEIDAALRRLRGEDTGVEGAP
jgi:mRNA-degrading endonuclease toxin of MazEF toxin-antitoxin module